MHLTHRVTGSEEGISVEKLLRNKLGFSTTGIRKLKRMAGVAINGQPVFMKQLVKAGDVLNVNLHEVEESNILPQPIGIDIAYEDDHLLVLNKPSGMLVHPLKHEPYHTLANGVMYYYQQRQLNFSFRPVSRLDRDTSGLVVVAKHAHASWQLARQLHNGQFERHYLAVVRGLIQQRKATIALPISLLPNNKVKRGVDLMGRRAITHYQVQHYGMDITVVRLQLETGRTHQIRVHLSHIGYPLLGDDFYGGEKGEISRQALHCERIKINHPVTGKTVVVTVPPPSDIQLMLDRCNEKTPVL